MTMGKWIAAAAMGVVLAATGCKSEPAGTSSTAQYTAIDMSTAGTIAGTIHFAGKAPKPVEIDMSQDPACTLGAANFSEGTVVNNGGLANVFVYVKDGLGNKLYAAPSQPVDIDQKGCRYVPHVVGVMVGQPVQFTNSDPTMHNIHMTPTVAGNQPVNISQAPSNGQNGAHDQATFGKPELMMPVRCNNHPWMQAFINVAPNPFFAVSDASGKFVIKGLPPGTYTVVADQETLGQQTATVTVGAKQTAAQDFTYGK
ncbi:MAG TPA: carboxypeptidase regulatory-like domain-containing protein [Acidobacteriaceae bacterium]|jgi:plastocyanin|nr:carboxypeptidase regulatory-like domain-containing protein [Acidobacteriaceae bacterium]